MTIPETVEEYSRYAAREFLQTAVFVDDRIFIGEERIVPDLEEIYEPSERKHSNRSVDKPAEFEKILIDDDQSDSFSSRDIVAGFARHEIVCSLYQPEDSSKTSDNSEILGLCEISDIVVVDWNLFGSGDQAMDLITELVKRAASSFPDQLRLVLVYTSERNLTNIAGILNEKVKKSIDAPLTQDGELAFHVLNCRVSVYGKHIRRERPSIDPNHIAMEAEIANKAVDEFAKLANGLLHAATLLGLAEIKKNSRRILSKFNAELDPGFLNHRSMRLPHEEASSHIIPLLVSEIEAVLDDVLPNPLINNDQIKDWCQNIWKPGAHTKNYKDTKDTNDKPIESKLVTVAEDICLNGFREANFSPKPSGKTTTATKEAAEFLLPNQQNDANQRFAHLMANRTFYDTNSPRTLKLGSIVYCEDSDTYLLCIQPICDSVRIKDSRAFVFSKLIKSGSGPAQNRVSILARYNGGFEELWHRPKSYDCRVVFFQSDSETRQVQSKTVGEEHVFTDIEKCSYRWIDELKTAHAQRAVERVASDLSRVGLTESEWIRLLGKPGLLLEDLTESEWIRLLGKPETPTS